MSQKLAVLYLGYLKQQTSITTTRVRSVRQNKMYHKTVLQII